MEQKKGLFIVLDGGEGSGKTTLLAKVKEHYGDRVVVTREPGGSPYAEEIRNLILHSSYAGQADAKTMFFLFWAARFDHLKNVIIPALESGKMVISDRFDSSTFAYQIMAQQAVELERLFWQLRLEYLGEYRPDMYVYLDLDPKIGLLRKTAQKDERKNHFDERKLDFHKALRKGFKEFLTDDTHGIKGAIISAKRSKEEVWEEFNKIITSL